MTRIFLLAVVSLGCLGALARAQVPAEIGTATTEQVQQTVDRAIGYLQTESAAWLNTRQCAPPAITCRCRSGR